MDKIFSPIKGRVIQFIEYVGITKEKFFESTDISASNFKGSGAKSELGGDKIVKIISVYPSINTEWLLTGEGNILKGAVRPIQERENRAKSAQNVDPMHELEDKMKKVEFNLIQLENTQQSMIEQLVEMQSFLNALSQVFGNTPGSKAFDKRDRSLDVQKAEKEPVRKLGHDN